MTASRQPDVWTIRDRQGNITTVPGDPNARIHVPEDLPTYRRLNCIHTGDPPMETRLRAASLEDSCTQYGVNPPSADLMDQIHQNGAVDGQQAMELQQFIRSLNGHTYLVDETLLLLEAAGHVREPCPPETPPDHPDTPEA